MKLGKSIGKIIGAGAMILGCGMLSSCSQKPEYANEFRTATRAFYLWRCGMPVEDNYNGNHYYHDACHLDDGYSAYMDMDSVKLDPRLREAYDMGHDGTGGWHDAGDYGKYTVNAGITVGSLFYAWDHFGDKINKIALDLPETAPGYPEFLKEIKWETDFLLKMEYPDGTGRVAHKLTRVAFAPFIMPEEDDGKRYYTVWSSAATADYAAMMAMSARYFAPYDKPYAQKCYDAANRSYNFLLAHPEDKRHIQGDFETGAYGTSDPDDRLWAAAEMWETTGNDRILKNLEERIRNERDIVDNDWDWGNVANLGVYTYALSQREGRDPELLAKVKEAIIADADSLVARAARDEYGRAMQRFYWGCNGTAARQAINIHVADMISPNPAYKETIKGIAKYLLGNNVYGRSFVTGLGVNPPMHPHDRRSGADGIDDPWPGYLVGGGHSATDWVDDQEDYSRNEIAINWQAGLVYLLAATL